MKYYQRNFFALFVAPCIMESILRFFKLALCCTESAESAQQRACIPFLDMLPHLNVICNDVILLSVLTEI